jgi:pimeloyl-ACP methyl ester carboxylesterase
MKVKQILLSLIMTIIPMSINANNMIKYKYQQVENVKVFYREAGNPEKPTILLLHGFPSSSVMFRELMPELADKYHLIAPDMPGFGQTEAPDKPNFEYSFDNLARTIDKFTETIGLTKFSMYIFDYGAPVGMRIAMWHPERIQAIISQNGNCYKEGLGKKWEARNEYWKHPTAELRKQYAAAYSLETIKGQYVNGTPENSVAPDGYTIDFAYIQLPGRKDQQDDLIFDYQNNVKLYPAMQEYLRKNQPPLLAIWGKNDPSFIPAGAEAFKHDVTKASVRFVDSGHFALESHHSEIAIEIIQFLKESL